MTLIDAPRAVGPGRLHQTAERSVRYANAGVTHVAVAVVTRGTFSPLSFCDVVTVICRRSDGEQTDGGGAVVVVVIVFCTWMPMLGSGIVSGLVSAVDVSVADVDAPALTSVTVTVTRTQA